MPSADPDEERAREAAMSAVERRMRPKPLTAELIEGWAAAVEMEPASMETLREVISIYLAAVADLDPVDRFDAQVLATHRWNRAARRIEPVYTPEYLRLLEMQWSVLTQLRDAERDLGATFVNLAPPELHARAQRIVFGRLFELVAVPTIRSTAGINVAALVDTLRLDEASAAAIAPTIQVYVQHMTAALGWRTDAAFGLERDRVRLLVDAGPLWEAAAEPADRAAIVDELAEIAEALVRTEVPISGINQEALINLGRSLPAEAAAELRRQFWSLANPELFREESELSMIILRSISNDEIEPADLAGREALLHAMQSNVLRFGFAASDFQDRAAAVDPAHSRDHALLHISLEQERLGAVARLREILLATANGLEGMLILDEMPMAHELRTWSVGVRTREAADRWIAQRLTALATRVSSPAPPVPEPPMPEPTVTEIDDRGADDDDTGTGADDGLPPENDSGRRGSSRR